MNKQQDFDLVIACGINGVPCVITALEADRVVLRCPDGLKRVPLGALIRQELSAALKVPTVGDHVKLKNTNLFYTILEVFEVPYWISGDRTVEMWARCQGVNRQIATWQLCQLEAMAFQ